MGAVTLARLRPRRVLPRHQVKLSKQKFLDSIETLKGLTRTSKLKAIYTEAEEQLKIEVTAHKLSNHELKREIARRQLELSNVSSDDKQLLQLRKASLEFLEGGLYGPLSALRLRLARHTILWSICGKCKEVGI